jgi:hypothetical protein
MTPYQKHVAWSGCEPGVIKFKTEAEYEAWQQRRLMR